ncbi:hypothetical protein EST38_g11824 [Candolleomyces aberdarensis]|uniref:RNA-directed DNA polymerase n=1 Tax=Candolleomyces aberdarensis TaxID=2316362 RepID=A0A4Q2D3Z0_9AGAR|nr:hypothetical protein EST38_g11824 [Candolleomyces aberdarensis]
MHIPAGIRNEQTKEDVEVKALLDSGAGDTFMDRNFAKKHRIPVTRLNTPIKVYNVDGTPNKEGRVSHFARIKFTVNNRTRRIPFLITGLGKEDIILGLPWLQKENPIINWEKGTLRWNNGRRTSWFDPIRFRPRNFDARAIEAELSAEVKPIWIQAKTTASQTFAQKHEEPRKEIPLKEQIPKEYHDYLSVFDKEANTQFPPKRPWDHAIDLKPDFVPRRGKIYSIAPSERNSLDEFIQENLAKGYIRPSKSPQASSFFFVGKKDGSLRPCQDYRQLNTGTIKNAYPLPRIPDLLDKLKKAKFFTKLDIRWGYNNVRIKEGDQWKAAFITNQGLFEPTVMFFGLTNSPATFQAMMDHLFEEPLRKGLVIIYMDDILIFAETEEQLEKITKEVLEILRKNRLSLKPEKCAFKKTSIDYLGFIVEQGRLRMDPAKIKGIIEWPAPTTVRQVRSFLGFGNFYRKFIRNYSKKAKPLNDLLKINKKFEWNDEAQEAFEILKKAFTEEPVLVMPDPEKPFQVEADASKFASGAVLTQMDSNGRRHPISYLSRTFNDTEQRWEIYDRELFGIIRALREWRHYLHGSPHPVTIYTDHLNLQYFKDPRKLNDRQKRWIPELDQFRFKLDHVPGTKMVISDALSRRPDHHPSEEEEPKLDVLLPEKLFIKTLKTEPTGEMYDETLRNQIIRTTNEESTALKALNELRTGPKGKDLEGWELLDTKEGTLLLFRQKVYVPDNLELRRSIVKSYHDAPSAGHPGQQATRLLTQRTYYWPGMTKFINKYVQGCPKCQQNKIIRRPEKPPLIATEASKDPRPFSHISMDFITDLPESNQFDSILVIVDQGLSKATIFTPCKKTISAEGTADILYEKLFTRYGRPNKVISDRDPRFLAGSFKEAMKRMGIKQAPSTAFHPQTDGTTERVNQEIQAYLSIFCTANPETWAERLPMAEFTHNSRTHAERTHSPFELLLGYNPEALPTAAGEYLFPATERRLKNLKAARSEALAAHELARMKMQQRNSRDFTPLKKGDKVWLDSRNLKLPYLSRKIAPKREGPFKIKEALSPVTYRLGLPEHWKIHDVFHATLLTPFVETETHGPAHPTPIPDIVDGQEEYEVEGILQHRTKQGRKEYLLRWKDQPTSEDSWEPEENLEHSQELLSGYWTRVDNRSKKKKEQSKRRRPQVKVRQIAVRTSTRYPAELPKTRIHRMMTIIADMRKTYKSETT